MIQLDRKLEGEARDRTVLKLHFQRYNRCAMCICMQYNSRAQKSGYYYGSSSVYDMQVHFVQLACTISQKAFIHVKKLTYRWQQNPSQWVQLGGDFEMHIALLTKHNTLRNTPKFLYLLSCACWNVVAFHRPTSEARDL